MVFGFCLCADWVCPCDPRAVVDVKELEKSWSEELELEKGGFPSQPLSFDDSTIQTIRRFPPTAIRYSRLPDGTIIDYEGPATYNPADYDVRETPRNGYTRVYLKPIPGATDDSSIERFERLTRGRWRVASQSPSATSLEAALLAWWAIVRRFDDSTIRRFPPSPISFPYPPCSGHPFGIDAGGRDVYARVVHGMRIALVFGLALAGLGLLFGLVIGAIEGYFGGVTDILLQRFTEIWSSIPFLYVMIFIGSTLGRSFAVLLVSYAVFNWIAVSYYMRAEFLRLRGRTFVEAAKVQGLSAVRIIFVHILPNALTPLITLFPFLLMGAIGSLAALDFLGFGLPPMTPSCGELLQEAQQFRSAWWLILFPSLALFIVMLLTVLVGEGLRDAFDPRQKSRLE